MVLKTANPEVAEHIADMFSAGSDLPKLEKGECYVMSVGDDGKLAITTEAGASPFLRVHAMPSALATIYGDKIQEMQQQVAMIGGMAGGQLGVSPSEINKLIDDVFAFPKQLDAIDIDVKGSPAEGFDGKVDIVAVADGWFGKFISGLEPNKAGAPQLAQPDALLHLITNMPAGALLQAAKPFMPFVVGSGAADKEEKAKFIAMMENVVGQFDGTLNMALTSDKSQKMVVGLTDGEKLNSLMTSTDYKAWRKAASEANPMADVEIKDGAVTHRDVSMTKTVTQVSSPMGEEKQTGFSGIAGAYMFHAGSESDAKGVVDTILDDKVKRAPLANGALLTLTAKVAEMVRVMSSGMADGEGAPSSLDLAMSRQGSALKFSFKVGM